MYTRYTIFFLFPLIQMNSIDQLQTPRGIFLLVCHSFVSDQISSTLIFTEAKYGCCLAFAFSKKTHLISCLVKLRRLNCQSINCICFLPFFFLLLYIYPSLESIILGLTPHPDFCYRTSASETFEWTCTRLVEDW